jgi:hypothetical protein
MNRTILSLLLISVVPSCSGSDRDPNARYSTLEGFCQQWGTAACNETVVENCQAASTDTCIESQKQFCMALVPRGYSPQFARECVSAVQDAYADARLTLEELNTVQKLEAPCHRVVSGAGEGASCARDSDCDMVSGLRCVMSTGAEQGVCAEPVVVDPGRSCNAVGQVCTQGFYCNGSNCIERKSAGSTCASDDECREDSKCEMADPGAGGAGGTGSVVPGEGTCTERAELSQSCDSHDDCKSNFCNGTLCANTVVLSQSEPICATLR